MTVTVVALTSVNEDAVDALGTYMGTTSLLLERAGARIVCRSEINETIVGSSTPRTLTIVVYPNRNALSKVFESAEYGFLKEIRKQAFSHYQILMIEGSANKIFGTPLGLIQSV